MTPTTEIIVDLAQQVEIGDPIDFGMLNISEHDAYNLMATGLMEQYHATEPANREAMLLAVTTKLIVENFVLNLKMRQNMG